jgi:hypothetical protein
MLVGALMGMEGDRILGDTGNGYDAEKKQQAIS